MNAEIKSTIESIIIVLSQNNEQQWADLFRYILEQAETDYQNTLVNIKSLFGGMGTFSDVVIHKDGWPLEQENDVLDDLRTHLYKLTRDELNNEAGSR